MQPARVYGTVRSDSGENGVVWVSQKWTGLCNWYAGLNWVRRRIYLMIAVLGVTWIFTAILLFLLQAWMMGPHADDMLRHVFGAFVGELIFFSIVGGVVTAVTLRDPRQEGFDERLRILYGGAQIPDAVSKFNRSEFARLSGYVKHAKRLIVIESYDAAVGAYRVKTRTSYLIQNLLPDVVYQDAVRINIRPDEFDTPPSDMGRVNSIKVGDVEQITNVVTIQSEGFTTETKIEIGPGSNKLVEFEYTTWAKLDHPQIMRPQRVVEQFDMDILSQCEQTPRIEIEGDRRGVISLLFNQPVSFPAVGGISPGEKVFVYKLLTPAGT